MVFPSGRVWVCSVTAWAEYGAPVTTLPLEKGCAPTKRTLPNLPPGAGGFCGLALGKVAAARNIQHAPTAQVIAILKSFSLTFTVSSMAYPEAENLLACHAVGSCQPSAFSYQQATTFERLKIRGFRCLLPSAYCLLLACPG
jgi:hypothetical protein